jgi:hypothetical protein
MWTFINDFIKNNTDNIIVSLITGVLFFVLGPLGLWFSNKKIRKEKINKSKDKILDLAESMLVNGEKVNEIKLSNIFFAVSRQNDVNLEIDTDLTNILEDLILRFASSKHLAPNQKDDYIEKIQTLIRDVETKQRESINRQTDTEQKREIPKSIKKIVDDMEIGLNENQQDSVRRGIEELKERLTIRRDDFAFRFFSVYIRLYKRNPVLFLILLIVVIAVYVIMIKSLVYSK